MGDGGVEEQKSELAESRADGNGGGSGSALTETPAVVSGSVEPSDAGGLQKMHSFGGIDVLEAGRTALEKRMVAVKTKSAPRAGGKLTLGKYLEKARVDT